MQLRHLLVATDESSTSRNALRAALTLAHRANARVTVLTTVRAYAPAGAGGGMPNADLEPDAGPVPVRLEQWIEAELRTAPAIRSVGLAVTFGIPGVEICRFADDHAVDLIVVGRKHRSPATRLLVGDTADAVARRSRVPCLFVPLGSAAPERVLVALDGSLRGLAVLRTACDFATAAGAALHAVTVEPVYVGESAELAALFPTGRTDALRQAIDRLAECHPAGRAPQGLMVRRGPIVESLLAAAADVQAGTIAVGFHRGGPPGVVETGSTARRLTHSAERAVLTVPL